MKNEIFLEFYKFIFIQKKNGEINYESISEMKYMDMVIDETLRLYPIGSLVERVASNDYDYKGLKMKKGQLVTVSVFALHRDPEIYPDPEEFQPERFSHQNRLKRAYESFMPFGVGPRNCIGMRFALIEMKLLLTAILSKYRFETCDKTPVNRLLHILSSG
jgi:cytochrome P450 family 3 subfamily A